MLERQCARLRETTAGVSLSTAQPHQHLCRSKKRKKNKSSIPCTPSGRNKMSECYTLQEREGGRFKVCRVTLKFVFTLSRAELHKGSFLNTSVSLY